jgi:hypothetical protein
MPRQIFSVKILIVVFLVVFYAHFFSFTCFMGMIRMSLSEFSELQAGLELAETQHLQRLCWVSCLNPAYGLIVTNPYYKNI